MTMSKSFWVLGTVSLQEADFSVYEGSPNELRIAFAGRGLVGDDTFPPDPEYDHALRFSVVNPEWGMAGDWIIPPPIRIDAANKRIEINISRKEDDIRTLLLLGRAFPELGFLAQCDSAHTTNPLREFHFSRDDELHLLQPRSGHAGN